MNCGLEFHGSRVSSVQSADDLVTILFEGAYLHRSDGAPAQLRLTLCVFAAPDAGGMLHQTRSMSRPSARKSDGDMP